MDLKSFRIENGFSQSYMVRKLTPHLNQFGLDVEFLDRFEKGEVHEDRHSAILNAAEKAFPNFRPTRSETTSIKRSSIKKRRCMLIVSSVLFFVISGFAFFVFRDHHIVEDISTYIGMLAALAGILGFLFFLISGKQK